MSKGLLRELLWLEINTSKDDTGEYLIPLLNACRRALDAFLDGLITWDDYLDVLQSNSVNVAEYLQVVENNFREAGLVLP